METDAFIQASVTRLWQPPPRKCQATRAGQTKCYVYWMINNCLMFDNFWFNNIECSTIILTYSCQAKEGEQTLEELGQQLSWSKLQVKDNKTENPPIDALNSGSIWGHKSFHSSKHFQSIKPYKAHNFKFSWIAENICPWVDLMSSPSLVVRRKSKIMPEGKQHYPWVYSCSACSQVAEKSKPMMVLL